LKKTKQKKSIVTVNVDYKAHHAYESSIRRVNNAKSKASPISKASLTMFLGTNLSKQQQ